MTNKLKWTSVRPTVSGWYFFRYWRNEGEPIMYTIFVHSEDGKLMADDGRDIEEMDNLCTLWDCEFAGPIKEPV